jgi:hypothetical protein
MKQPVNLLPWSTVIFAEVIMNYCGIEVLAGERASNDRP